MRESDPDAPMVFAGIAGVGAYTWHVAENRLVWSRELTTLYGVRQSPTAEQGFTQLVHPEDRMRVEAEISSFLEGGDSYEHEFRILRPGGEVRYIHDRGVIERAADGTALVLRGLNVDVTHQRVMQAADYTARLGAAKGIGFYEYGITHNRSWWSAEMFRIFDATYRDRIDPDAVMDERVYEEDRDRLRALQDTASHRLGPYEIEYRIRRRDGRLRWIRDRGETLGPLDPVTGRAWQIRGTATDITGHKERTQAIPAGSETFQQVIERAPFGICVIDADFRLVHASVGAMTAFGGIEPLIGRNYGDLLRRIWPEPFASAAIGQFRHTLETGEPHHAPSTRERRYDKGRTEVYDWALERISLPNGRPGVVCYFYDLSNRVRQDVGRQESEERLQLAYEAAGMVAWDLDLVTGDVVWSPQLYELLALDPAISSLDPAISSSTDIFSEMIHPDDRGAVEAELARAIDSGRVFDAVFRIRGHAGVTRHVLARGRVIRHDGGHPARMTGVIFDVTERHGKDRDSVERLRLVLDSAVAFIGTLDLEGRILEANAMALEAGDVGRDEVIGQFAWETYGWSYDTEVAGQLRAAIARAAAGEIVRYDAVARSPNEGRVTVDMLLSPILGDDRSVREIVVSGFDVTEREKAKEHAEFLMREINHRSKNILALIQAIARQIWKTDPEDFFSRFQTRLQALASSQDILVKGKWNGASLEQLAQSQLAHFADLIGSRIRLEGPPASLSAEAAQALGMAFHELATNAVKYGALSNETGNVDIAWHLKDRSLSVSWVEHGGPPVSPPTRKGFGSVVLDTIVRGSLSADVRIDYPPEGLRWTLTCTDKCLVA